jgi:hypothetical protein
LNAFNSKIDPLPRAVKRDPEQVQNNFERRKTLARSGSPEIQRFRASGFSISCF